MAARLLVLAVAILTSFGAGGVEGVAAQPSPWRTAQGGSRLTRPAFWEALPGVVADTGQVIIDGRVSEPSLLLVDRFGPRIDVRGDFRVVAGLQSATDSLAVLSLLDAWADPTNPSPASARVEIGLQHGQTLLQVFDGSSQEPAASQSFASDTALGPVTLGLTRTNGTLSLDVSGQPAGEVADPGVFASGTALLGARVGADNRLTLQTLDVQRPVNDNAPPAQTAPVTRCAPDRLLIAGSPSNDTDQTGLYWLYPDTEPAMIRPIDVRPTQRSFLVAISPDNRWVAYYQRSALADTDRFIVDTWILDIATDERIKLVDGTAPLAWVADSSAIALGDRPNLMAAVPSGELLPTTGQLIPPDSMRAVSSPDNRYRAAVGNTPAGEPGFNVLDTSSGDLIFSRPTGRGAPQLAWAPDSRHLAFTSGTDSSAGLIWKLRMLDLTDQSVALVESTQDMAVHSVLWTPRSPACP